jgi:prepilin-type N-terminal cleavage/methylation domain-containing protein
MLKINRKLSKEGFSLIELMVAVVILALAIFGIFQAYSTGFMGMADARDRTVATNYLREAIEDFKNMDFDQVKNTPITAIPDTKFSRGTYVLKLEEIDGVATLKKVITQVRWIDRKGNIKTEKASTILYNKPTTSDESDAERIIIYAQPYYTILPNYAEGLDIYAEIKDENGNTVYSGDITFSIITEYGGDEAPVGYIYEPSRSAMNPTDTGTESAPNGIANVKFYPFTVADGTAVDGIERIQASAIIDGVEETDTVNIRVTTGPVGILIKPVSEEDDRVLVAGAGVESNLKLYVVKADYETYVAYDSQITLSADGPGTLSETTIASVPTEGTSFTLASDGTPGIVEITASAPDLDIGYIEITFTGEPASILITPGKKSIYPGEDINITVTIVDVNNVPVDFDGEVILSADPDYGSFNPSSLDFGSTILLELKSTFTAYTDALPGETINIQANSGSISGSTEITILSSLTPKYLDLSSWPFSVDLYGGESSTTVTATVYDDSGNETVTTYNTPISFIAKISGSPFGDFSDNNVIPIDGEAEVILSSDVAGTVTITASSGDLILRPEGGVEVVFYYSADHIELSADPLSIEAGGNETSIITATMCDAGGNEVVNYNNDPANPKHITFTSTVGKFHILGGSPAGTDTNEITEDDFDGGVVIVEFYSDITSENPAEISALSSDSLSDNGHVFIALTGDIPTVISLGDVINWDDYIISFGIIISGSSLHLDKMQIEWDNSNATLDEVEINSDNIASGNFSSIHIIEDIQKDLFIGEHDIAFTFSGSKMKNKNITVTFIDNSDPPNEYEVSFKVPN